MCYGPQIHHHGPMMGPGPMARPGGFRPMSYGPSLFTPCRPMTHHHHCAPCGFAARETAGTVSGIAVGAGIGAIVGNVPGAIVGGLIGGVFGNAASRPWW